MKRGSKEYWACLRKEIRWAIIDVDGDEYGLSKMPVQCNGVWRFAGSVWGINSLAVEDRNAVPWQESLIERPHEWQVPDESTPADAKVWVRSRKASWLKRHFAAVVNGKFFAWANGHTSWTADWTADHQSQWEYAVLADPDNHDREPPKDYVPSN
jgi:hypothetical protein